MHNDFQTTSHAGFTLIEIIIVIALIGILSITVVHNWPSTSLNLDFTARQLLNDIRYTQALSMTSGQRYRWVKMSNSAYQVLNQSGIAVVLPSGLSQQNLASNIQFGSFTNLPNSLIAFDSQGTPYTDTASTTLSATATITLISGSQTRSILITPQTGFQVLQ